MRSPASKERFARAAIVLLAAVVLLGLWQGYGSWLLGWFQRHVA